MGYDSAIAMVSEKLSTLAEELWPEVLNEDNWYAKHGDSVKDKAHVIYTSGYCIKDDLKRKKFNMLYNIKDDTTGMLLISGRSFVRIWIRTTKRFMCKSCLSRQKTTQEAAPWALCG